MRSHNQALGRKFHLLKSEPCKWHLVNYRANVKSSASGRSTGLGALPKSLRGPITSSSTQGLLVAPLRLMPGRFANLASCIVAFGFVIFPRLDRKENLVRHLYYWTQIFTDAYCVLGILQSSLL